MYKIRHNIPQKCKSYKQYQHPKKWTF